MSEIQSVMEIDKQFLLEDYRLLQRSLLIHEGLDPMDAHLWVTVGELALLDQYSEKAKMFEDYGFEIRRRMQADNCSVQESLDIWNGMIKTDPQDTMESFLTWQAHQYS